MNIKTRSPGWSFLSKHGQALLILAKNPTIKIMDLASKMQMSERSVRLLITRLHENQVLIIRKRGRNNEYEVDFEALEANEADLDISFSSVVRRSVHG